ncbi:UDP-N-acetylmuramoyl-L-alanyl-D-glutamate--2,6-diaminopimelate ligase [Actinopolyspora xinjiangensis]|uniref:UDP-N-acetylmuramoyl-L-alanyl-D-glutamate--2, 6-diaminopimelate ligase n=1 Tax=Actinopolyspora xinjiangensis TaxID=405564 RepID=UPI001FCCF40C|nr:UDP-N-acetylmuramoyl-L-alanyl-D-glutamate--2,6-diaminopimelate ligase [Actinopolyspora xinjiangensis]
MPSPVASSPPRPSSVEPVRIEELAQSIGARLVRLADSRAHLDITGVTLRAQHVRPGDLFAALRGARTHGAEHSATALDAGAVAVLTDETGAAHPSLLEHPAVARGEVALLVHPDPRGVLGELAAEIYGHPSDRLSVLGVTGTSGKTTTSYLLDSALRSAGLVTGLIGTVETRVAGSRLESAFTTPEAPDLQALLAVMVERGVTHVVMEVSSHALVLGRVSGVRFAVGGFTNLSSEHLDFHRDMEDYFAAKAMLFDGRCAREVVCTDTEWGRRLVGSGTVTVATEGTADWTATDVLTSPTGAQRFTAAGPEGVRTEVELRLPGAFNVANALLAVAMSRAVGVECADIARGLGEVDVPGRMERVALGQDFTAVVDYSHKPGAVGAVLEAARAQAAGKVLVVLGCGGDRDTAKRPVMGATAARRADVLIVTDDNPRGEDPARIRAAVLEGATRVPPSERAESYEIGDRRAAIAEAIRRAGSGDVVVVAGKGHETGQEVAGVVHPFSDRDEVAAALRGRLGSPQRTETVPTGRTPDNQRGSNEEAR